MYREAIEKLKAWKDKPDHKPLVIMGARQVGKTWLMKEFGSKYYESYVYVNCDNNSTITNLFAGDLDIERIVQGLQLWSNVTIEPKKTLIILDEIQEVPNALNSLKYFCEDAPQYDVIAAGSLLGIALHENTSFPVGKVEFLRLYPMTFKEFLLSLDKDGYVTLIDKQDYRMMDDFASEYDRLLKLYYFVGGMPGVVSNYVEKRDLNEVAKIQEDILTSYDLDYSKHAPNNAVPRIRSLWNNIPSQLGKENKKFIYGQLREGARAKDYEYAINWLIDAGTAYKVQRLTAPRIPTIAYEDYKAFKLFVLDVGLLARMSSLRPEIILEGQDIYTEFKGALTEQYVLEQIKTDPDLNIHYWSADKATAEIDFVIDDGMTVVPLEVKAADNTKAKSLYIYHNKFDNNKAFKVSTRKYEVRGNTTYLPLWAISNISKHMGR